MSLPVQVFGRWNAETIRALWQPASEKRQGRKSRSVVQRRCGGRYGDFAAACWLRKFDEIGRFAWFSLEHEWARSGDGAGRFLCDEIGGNGVRSGDPIRAWRLPAESQQK
jgi:hypothetical protein